MVGEPGIGKTSLCEQLATYAVWRRGTVLVGHCYEEGSHAPPYLPFVEALRSYVLAREPEHLERELGSGAADVARIVSEVRDRVAVEPRPGGGGDPEEERYRLLQAVTGFLRNAAAVQPLVLILEDLHDADRGTLDLLIHLSRNLQGTRLLVVGTYRDIEVDRAHPLSGALAELRRVSAFSRVLLRGLTADEVQRMLSGIAGQDVSWGLAEAVHRQTEGNPLFVQEVVRYLAEEGLIEREGGRWRATDQAPLVLSIPEGLRDVIGKRLSRLSPECNRVLSIASVIGRDFALATLRAVAGIPEDDLVTALEEALRVAVLQEQSGPSGGDSPLRRGTVGRTGSVGGVVRYRFAHAFFRQMLYEELSAPRRIRLHQQVARALEGQHAARLDEHAAELAEHFAYSSDPADLAKAVEYGERAARRAVSVYAYGEAARLLEQALDVQEVLDPDDKGRRCDLLLALADALLAAGEPRRVLDAVAPEALALAEALSDAGRAARVCQLALWSLVYYGAGPTMGTPETARWAALADRYAEPETVARVWANVFLGAVRVVAVGWREGNILLSRALDLARRLDDPEALWLATGFWILSVQGQQYAEQRRELARELATSSRTGMTSRMMVWLPVIGSALLSYGLRSSAEEVWREIGGLAERRGSLHLRLDAMQVEGVHATLDGRLAEAVAVGERIVALGEERGLPYARVGAALASVRALLYLGRAGDALPLSSTPEPRALILAHAGRAAEVADQLERLVLTRPGIGSGEDETPVWRDVMLLEAAVVVEHRDAARLLLRQVAGGGSVTVTTGAFCPTCIARHLGAAAALLGDREAAQAYYAQALEVAGSIRFRPEVALTRLAMAELEAGTSPHPPTPSPTRGEGELAPGGHPRAIVASAPLEEGEPRVGDSARTVRPSPLVGEGSGVRGIVAHLDFAIAEFRAMKMQPALQYAVRLKESLAAQQTGGGE